MFHNDPGMIRRIAFFLSLFALALAGCSPSGSLVGGKPYRKKKLAIVSLSPSATEILLTYGVQSRLVGRTEACNFPPAVKPIEIVCTVKPDYERIAKLDPGLIVYDAQLFSAADIERLKAPDRELYSIQGDTVPEFMDSVLELGHLMHTEPTASEYTDRISIAYNKVKSDPLTKKVKVAIVIASPTGQHMIAGKKSFAASCVGACGAEIVGPDSNKFEALSPESFIQMAPDGIIIATTKNDAEVAVKSLVSDPRIKSTAAIVNDKVFSIDQDVVLRRGSRVDKLIEISHRKLKALFP
jgi:iron complex transport system substrate-binding protein